MEGPPGAPIPYFSISILYYQVSFQLDHFQDFVLQIFFGEEFFQPKMLLLKREFPLKILHCLVYICMPQEPVFSVNFWSVYGCKVLK